MKVLIQTLVNSIERSFVDEKSTICLVFHEILHGDLLTFFIRNVRIVIISKDEEEEKHNKPLIQTITEQKGGGLYISLKTIIPLEGNKEGGKARIMPGPNIEAGDQILLYHGRTFLRKLTLIGVGLEEMIKEL